MDILKKITYFVGKNRYAVIVLAIGLILMLLPFGTGKEEIEKCEPIQEQVRVDQLLEQVLSTIDGVGKVKVMLTVETGESIIYQTDTGATSIDTVIITDKDRAEVGLIKQIDPPKYRGAIIVCQGAESAAIRLSIVEAVSKVTGLGADRISVLKMK